MKHKLQILLNGIFKENPVLILVLGCCSALAISVTVLGSLGIFLPLIVVNCIVLGRAEMFANKNTIGDSLFDGIGMGIGYTMVLTAMAIVRELFGAGTLLGKQIIPEEYTIRILAQTPGGFFMFGLIMALLVWGLARHGKKFEPKMGCDGECGACGSADSCADKEAKSA